MVVCGTIRRSLYCCGTRPLPGCCSLKSQTTVAYLASVVTISTQDVLAIRRPCGTLVNKQSNERQIPRSSSV